MKNKLARVAFSSLATAFVACGGDPASSPPARALPPPAASSAPAATTPLAQAQTAPPADDAGAANAEEAAITPADQWPFLDHAIASCVRDGLTRTDYLRDWYDHARASREGPPGGPRPMVDVLLPVHGPTRGSEDYDRERAAFLTEWNRPERQSHVMDCTVRVAMVRDGRDRGTWQVPYAIYLPADYLDHPFRQRAILLLASGGGGNRTRWFLRPLRTDGAKRATGGLEMRARMDAWAAAHPDAAPPLVVAVDGSSDAFVNGMAAFIDHELPDHLVSAYLPHQTREQTPYGVEAVSSGAAFTMRAIRANPHLFSSVGLTSLYCAKAAFDPRRDFGHKGEREALLAELAARHENGLFDIRLSVGSIDQYWECNYELFRNLRTAGVLAATRDLREDQCASSPWKPTVADPPSSPAVHHCAGQWPAFESWRGAGHHYRALLAALPSALEWDLDRLQRALERDGKNAPEASAQNQDPHMQNLVK